MNIFELAKSADTNMVNVVDAEELEYQKYLLQKFEHSVSEVQTLIEMDEAYIMHNPLSFGKDSTLMMLINLEAYRRSIADGKIEATRPLLANCVNTKVESLPMVMYTRYAAKRLSAYAQEHNINLQFQIVSPSIMDEYFIRWASGQKLIPSVLRHSDCSMILKVQTSERYVSNVMDMICTQPNMAQYITSPRITTVGSRSDESARRSANIKNQDLKANIEEVKEELSLLSSVSKKQSKPIYKFAPIRDWSTQEVFDILALSGVNPVTESLLPNNKAPIPSFLPSGALLLEIYGNGSNEVCELVVGEKNGAGCQGTARYGCWSCTMSNIDKSSTAISEYERWRILGSEYALRVRDYLYRIGHDNSKRALHARAYCPVGYNRVLLQPNVLKSKYLEKMVWYASQLTQYSHKVASEFSELVKQGREAEFSGYADILNDTLMNPKAKAEFLEMYREQAQTPLIDCFSEKHAALLSVRWSIDGINSAPFRPLAIWNKVATGESLPWPKTMVEHERVAGPFKMDAELPDALALPVLKESKYTPKQFAEAELDLLSMYEMPTHYRQIWELDMNCSMKTNPRNSLPLKIDYSLKLSISDEKKQGPDGFKFFSYVAGQFNEEVIYCDIEDIQITSIKLGGKSVNQTVSSLIEPDAKNEIKHNIYEMLESINRICEHRDFESAATARAFIERGVQAIRDKNSTTLSIPHLKLGANNTSINRPAPIKVSRRFASTQRVVKRVKGKIQHGNTRLRTYKAHLIPRFEQANTQTVEFLQTDFNTDTHYDLPLQDNPLRFTDELLAINNLDFNENAFCNWLINGGKRKALDLHDTTLRQWIRSRRYTTSSKFRRYGGTHVAETMMREGGLGVAKGYYEQLSAIMQRTHLFEEIGAFNFANMSYDELLKSGACKTMTEHRKDKTEVLLCIRKIRNERRAATKNQLRNQNALTPVENSLKPFLANLFYSMEGSLKLGMEGRLNCRFFDDPVTYVARGNAYGTLVRFYAESFADINKMALDLFGRNTQNNLVENNLLLPLAKSMKAWASPMLGKARITLEQYKTKLNSLESLLNGFREENAPDMTVWRNKFRELMIEIHEEADDTRFTAFFPESKRNAMNFEIHLEQVVKHLNEECTFQTQLLDSIEKMIDKATQTAIKKISFKDRLAAMTILATKDAA